jgi:hypothetical protein
MEESTPSKEENRQVSANDIDYAKYVLYVRKGIPSCDHLVRLASQCLDIIVQDVDRINGPKPPWLRGVPSLVQLPGFKLLTGTEALKAMEAHVRQGIQAMPGGFIGSRGGAAAGTSLVEEEGVSGRMGFDLNISNDDRYEDAPRERNAGGSSLEDMMRLRAASSKTLQIP